MSKLLSHAKAKLEGSKFYRTRVSEDDAFVDSLCFELQQSLELALKAIVELSGERYVENHDVRAQLNKLDALGVKVPNASEIRNLAVTINSWETESRYRDSFIATMSEVDDVLSYTESVIAFAETLVSVSPVIKKIEAF